jgi:excisionase family DNA binding protein
MKAWDSVGEQMRESVTEDLVSPEEAARTFKVSKWTIYRWIKEGRLEATKISRGSLRIFRGSIHRLISEHRVQKKC